MRKLTGFWDYVVKALSVCLILFQLYTTDVYKRQLYIHSPLRNNSFIMIDCELINDKSWAFLINSSGSPFGENNQTYYFKNLDRLAENKYRQLEFVLLEQSLPQRDVYKRQIV